VRNAPPADTSPQIMPIASPMPNIGPGPGSVRPGAGLRLSSICVAPAYTMTANDRASTRCGSHPEASVEPSAPTTIPGDMRRNTLQSTAPIR